MKQRIQQLLQEILVQMEIGDVVPMVESAGDVSHGDYTSNVAMTAFTELRTQNLMTNYANPREFAQAITDAIKTYNTISKLEWLDHVEVAGPGFINFFLSEASFINVVDEVLKMQERFGSEQNQENEAEKGVKNSAPDVKKTQEISRGETPQIHTSTGHVSPTGGQNSLKNSRGTTEGAGNVRQMRRVMVEFAHPNTHKAFHIGHLRNISTGESIVRLLEAVGKKVIRVNYQGDVGMHIAKALYGLLQNSELNDQISTLNTIQKKVEFLGKAYTAGSKAYEEGASPKEAIEKINKQIYAKDTEVYGLYQTTRQWSLDYFNTIYKRVGSRFDRLYFESETYESGKRYIQEGLKKGIFEESEGAVIFPGEKFGLHNRVFITGEGNTTYEGKDIGLGPLQFKEYDPDLIIHVVGPEQAGYFQVVFEALAQLFPDTRGREYHLIYGWVKLKHGKMSSRSGVVVLGEWLLDEAEKEIRVILSQSSKKYSKQQEDEIASKAAVAAVKYAFLKVGTKQEIAFDLAESVNFEGDSGPYLQYTYARCRSVLRRAAEAQNPKSKIQNMKHLDLEFGTLNFNKEEKAVARLLIQFPEIVSDAAYHFTPNTLCTYLYKLAAALNVFYAKHAILGNPSRIALAAATAQVLKNGLYLLGIETMEEM